MTGEATDLVARLRSNEPLPVCPYDRRSPDYWTAPDDKPCVICGTKNEDGAPDLCRGADTRVMAEAAALIEAQAAEIEGLRKAVEPFAKAGQLFDTGDYAMYDASIYRPAAGDDFSLHSGHLLAARRAFLASRTERADG